MPKTKVQRSLEKRETAPTAVVHSGGNYFSSVKKARLALKEKALATYEKLNKIIDMAAAAGDFETAAKYAWMLIEHTPSEDGETVIDGSAAKPKLIEDGGHKGPVIQINMKMGGLQAPPETNIIDIARIDERPSLTESNDVTPEPK